MASDWSKLYRRLQGAEGGDRDRTYRARLAAETTRQLDAWCLRAVEVVTSTCHHLARQRAEDFRRATGHTVRVIRPDAARVPGSVGHLIPTSLLRLELGSAGLHLYTSRKTGHFPKLFFVVDQDAVAPRVGPRKPTREASLRVVSVPAAVIERGADGLPALRRPDPGGGALSTEALVYRAFELLVEAYRAQAGESPKRTTQRVPKA